MNRLFCLLFLLLPGPVVAQKINGSIRDWHTHQPIANVQVSSNQTTAMSNNEGRFTLEKIKAGDKISLRLMGYETQEITIQNSMLKGTMIFEMKTTIVELNAITVMAKRNYKLDSLALRKEFAKEFNDKGTGIKDMFVTINPEYKPPLALRKPNSTSAIASINVLQLFSLLGKNKAPNSKLKETLLRDEEANYVAHVFSKSKIESVTQLKGDSLQNFIRRYRPSAAEAKKMTEYELLMYIKQCYQTFIKH